PTRFFDCSWVRLTCEAHTPRVRPIPRRLLGGLVPVALSVMAACSSSPHATSTPTSGTSPTLRAADFPDQGDNPRFPLPLAQGTVSTGTKAGKAARDVVTVTRGVAVIDGVPTRMVKDRLYLDGKLGESTTDYYTQNRDGTVWYFGEDTMTLDARG